MRLNSSTIQAVRLLTTPGQLDTWIKHVPRVQALLTPHLRVSTATLATHQPPRTSVSQQIPQATAGNPSIRDSLSLPMLTLLSQELPTDDHTSTTVSLPTIGTPTRTAVTLTLTSLLVSNSSISVPPTMVMTATTVSNSADKVQCTSLTTEIPTLSVTFGPTINLLYHTAVQALLDRVQSLRSGLDTTLTTATPLRALTVQHTTV